MKLTKSQAEHLYELCYENFVDGCYECDKLKSRLEKYIGEKMIDIIKRELKRYPYK